MATRPCELHSSAPTEPPRLPAPEAVAWRLEVRAQWPRNDSRPGPPGASREGDIRPYAQPELR